MNKPINKSKYYRKKGRRKEEHVPTVPLIKKCVSGSGDKGSKFINIVNNKILRIVEDLTKKKLEIRKLTSDKFAYQHIACFFVDSPISIGENSTREAWCGCTYGMHAEMEALSKLHPCPPNSKKKIDLIVIRVDLNGQLRNSKPCSKCIEHLCRLKKYKIQNVYYSDKDGNIIMERFSYFAKSGDMHISRRFQS
jgi:hypothetical protein